MENLKKYLDFFNQFSSRTNLILKIIGLPILMLFYLVAVAYVNSLNDH